MDVTSSRIDPLLETGAASSRVTLATSERSKVSSESTLRCNAVVSGSGSARSAGVWDASSRRLRSAMTLVRLRISVR